MDKKKMMTASYYICQIIEIFATCVFIWAYIVSIVTGTVIELLIIRLIASVIALSAALVSIAIDNELSIFIVMALITHIIAIIFAIISIWQNMSMLLEMCQSYQILINQLLNGNTIVESPIAIQV